MIKYIKNVEDFVMTLENIALEAGVSVGSVSKAFKGSPEISKKTRDKIFEIAKKHGCFDKYYKVPRHRPVIALMPPEPESEYYGNEIGVLERALFLRGADTLIAFTRFSPEKEARLFRMLAYEMKIDGFILWSDGELIKNNDKIPLVALTSRDSTDNNAEIIKIDTDAAISKLAETLKSFGHTKVAFIGDKYSHKKCEALRKAMRGAGIPIHNNYMIISDKRFADAGIEGMKKLTSCPDIPTVIVAAYDEIAYGAMQYAEKNGFSIPDDISFVGMDDISVTEYLGVPLSSMHFELDKISDLIADIIFRKIENKHYKERTEITVPVTLKIRESLKDISKK